MRQITIEAVRAFDNWEKYNKSNTSVEFIGLWLWEEEYTFMYLHWNKIAEKQGNKLILKTCGRETTTTKERLNWILDYYNLWVIKQKNFSWYLYKPSGEIVPFDSVMTFNI